MCCGDTPPHDYDDAAGNRSPVPGWLLVLPVLLALIALALITGQHIHALYRATLGRVDALNLPAAVLTELFRLKPVFLIAVVLLLVDRRLRWGFAVDFGVVMLVQALVGNALKDVFNRMRPDSLLQPGVFLGPQWNGPGHSFPSGHAVAAWALAALMSSWYPRRRWVFYVVAAAVCWSRLQLNAHYLGDVIAGSVVGWYITQGILAWMGRA